jgi:hypothetical protein
MQIIKCIFTPDCPNEGRKSYFRVGSKHWQRVKMKVNQVRSLSWCLFHILSWRTFKRQDEEPNDGRKCPLSMPGS